MDPKETAINLESLAESLARIQELLAARDSQSETHRYALEQLHAEMERYRQDFLFQAEKNLLLDLLSFHDSLQWFRQAALAPDANREIIEEGTQYLVDEILELLYRQDIQPVENAEHFDRTTHRAIQVVYTSDPEQDQRIHKVVRRGFLRGERVLRPEDVVVWRHRAQSADETSVPGTPTSPLDPP